MLRRHTPADAVMSEPSPTHHDSRAMLTAVITRVYVLDKTGFGAGWAQHSRADELLHTWVSIR